MIRFTDKQWDEAVSYTHLDVYKRQMQDLGLINSWFALWFPWISGGQVFGIMLCRTFMGNIPSEIFESVRIDGCGEFRALLTIAMPLSKPILATIAINQMIGYYLSLIHIFVETCETLQEHGVQPITMAGDFNSFWAGAMGWLAQVYTDQTTSCLLYTSRCV